MSEKIRLASVGLGRWAQVLARGAQRGDVIELYSCFTRSEERRRTFMEQYGVPKSASTLDGPGPVSRACATEMASGARRVFGAVFPGRGAGALQRRADLRRIEGAHRAVALHDP